MIQFPDNLTQRDILKKALGVYPDSVELDVIDINEFKNIMLLWDSWHIKVVDRMFEDFQRYEIIRYFNNCSGMGKPAKLRILITPLGIERLQK